MFTALLQNYASKSRPCYVIYFDPVILCRLRIEWFESNRGCVSCQTGQVYWVRGWLLFPHSVTAISYGPFFRSGSGLLIPGSDDI